MKAPKLFFILFLLLLSSCVQEDILITGPNEVTVKTFGKSRLINDTNTTLFWKLDDQGISPVDGKIHLSGYIDLKYNKNIDFGIITPEKVNSGEFWVSYPWSGDVVTKHEYTCEGAFGWVIPNYQIWCNTTNLDINNTPGESVKNIINVTPDNYVLIANKTIWWNTTKYESLTKRVNLAPRKRYVERQTPYGDNIYFIKDLNVKKGTKYNFDIVLDVDKQYLPLKYTIVIGDIDNKKLWFIYDPTITDLRTWTTEEDFDNETTTENITLTNDQIELSPSSVLQDDLLLYYTFDTGDYSGASIYDKTDNSYTATLAGGYTTGTTGKVGKALTFAGAGWATTAAYLFSSGRDYFSTSLWFKSTQSTKGQFYTSYSGGIGDWLQFYISNPTAGDISFNPSTGGLEIAGSWNDGDWHHVVGTYEDGYAETWIDGVKEGTKDSSPHTFYGGNIIILGAYDGATGKQNYNGVLDEIGIWDGVLTDANIATLYNSGDGIGYDDMVGDGRSGNYLDVQKWSPQINGLLENISIEITQSGTGSVLFKYNKTNSSLSSSEYQNLTTNGTNNIIFDFDIDDSIYYEFYLEDSDGADSPKITSYTIYETIPPYNTTIDGSRTWTLQGDFIRGTVLDNITVSNDRIEVTIP